MIHGALLRGDDHLRAFVDASSRCQAAAAGLAKTRRRSLAEVHLRAVAMSAGVDGDAAVKRARVVERLGSISGRMLDGFEIERQRLLAGEPQDPEALRRWVFDNRAPGRVSGARVLSRRARLEKKHAELEQAATWFETAMASITKALDDARAHGFPKVPAPALRPRGLAGLGLGLATSMTSLRGGA